MGIAESKKVAAESGVGFIKNRCGRNSHDIDLHRTGGVAFALHRYVRSGLPLAVSNGGNAEPGRASADLLGSAFVALAVPNSRHGMYTFLSDPSLKRRARGRKGVEGARHVGTVQGAELGALGSSLGQCGYRETPKFAEPSGGDPWPVSKLITGTTS